MKKNYPLISLGSPGEEISTKDLHAVIQRFKNLNQYKLFSVQNFLQPRQQIFLNLLPLIFHQNQALLPGFVSSETPAGISDYAPNKATILAAKQFSKSYRYTRKALRNYDIEGIFLMGSVGSIAFSKTSDMDIWLCHSPELEPEAVEELQQKADDVEKWAQSLELEVHFFLINSDQFRRGEKAPISSESSGATQHYLLLEEFYRTAIYIAGKAPAWWVVPPDQEEHYNDYIKHLLDNRFISRNEVIDFGGLQNVPAEEFISATLWHIYKSLDSPFKSLLKLFLMECYASEYPQPQWICQSLKTAVYSGKFDIDKLDPYLLIYEKVEEYLHLVASQKQLSLSRQCFYLKIMGSSPKSLNPKLRVLREEFLQDIARKWRWPADMLNNFCKYRYWDINKATHEHLVIRDQLKQCLRMILRFAGRYVEGNYRDNKDLKLIGRKLHAFLEYKPGKVEVITTRSSIHKKEEELSIIEIEQEHAEPLWHLYCGHVSSRRTNPAVVIKEGESLLEILCWVVVNRLYQNNLKIHFESHSLKISNTEIQQILVQLHRFFDTHLETDDETLEIYNHPNQLLSTLLIVNLGEILPEERDNGQVVISPRSDPLSYGENRRCFVHRIDQISVSSWGEITVSKHLGIQGFFHCTTELFNNSKTPLSDDTLQVLCYTPLRAKSITLRIKSIVGQLTELFQDSSPNWRYILPAKDNYQLFTRQGDHLTYWPIETNDLLIQELAATQQYFAPVCFDPHVLSNTFIPFLYSQIDPGTIQVFYHAGEKHVAIYIIDEKASLFTRQHINAKPEHVLADYFSFLHGLIDQAKIPVDTDIRFLEIEKNSAGIISCKTVKVVPQESFMDLNIRIIAASSGGKTHSITIYCNDKEFSSIDGGKIFPAVREHILSFRNSHEDYPFHINEIDVPAPILGVSAINQAHTVHFLQYKQKIESRLMG